MELTLSSDLEQFVNDRAKARGFASPTDYVRALLELERRRAAEAADLREQLRLAAVERCDEDRAMAEEWFGLEEEAHAQADGAAR